MYILIYSKLQLFYFLLLIYKKTFGSNGSPVGVVKSQSRERVKTNGIFKTSLLSFQHRLLELVWIGSIQYLTKTGSFK